MLRLRTFLPLLCLGSLLTSCRDGQTTVIPAVKRFEPTAVADDLPFGEAAYAHTANILGFGPRPPGSEGLANVRTYVADELAKAGWTAREQHFQARLPQPVAQELGKAQQSFANVIARYEDAQKTADFVLCAHIDSKRFPGKVFLGADDAASAVAAILVLAKHLASESPELAKRIEIVFFDGEEALVGEMGPERGGYDGLYGSRFYTATWRDKDSKPRTALLLDMVGHRDLSLIVPGNCPPELTNQLLAAAAAEGGVNTVRAVSEHIADDHVPLNLGGIPCVNLLGDFQSKDWWHSTGEITDDLSIVDPDSLDFSMRTALRYLNVKLAE